MLGQRLTAREFGRWLVGRWRTLLIVLVLAPVLGPVIAVYCLLGGLHAMSRSRLPKVVEQTSVGETLDALIATVLPAAVYGCAVWGLRELIPSSSWAGWIPALLVAGLVTLVVGSLSALYIFGYSLGNAQAEAYPPPLVRRSSPPMSLTQQMLKPFRQRPP
jgi:hypothetical protein